MLLWLNDAPAVQIVGGADDTLVDDLDDTDNLLENALEAEEY